MKTKEIPPAKPYFPDDDIRLLQEEMGQILRSGMLTLGEYTKSFEAEFAKISGVSHAVAVNSGTSALEIALRSIGLKKTDEVLVPTNTFSATATAVIFAGGRPVLTDIDPRSLCLDAKNIQQHINSKTKAVLAVHVGGLICPEIKKMKEICDDCGVVLIEDAAHAQGSTIDNQPAGSIGQAGCFSFYPTKVMTTGEGGMITTNRNDIATMATVLRDQGKQDFSGNIIIELGYNWRMNEISAAIGLTQLKRLPDFIANRNRIARFYDDKMSRMEGIEPLIKPANIVSNYYKYVVFLSPSISRDNFKQKLRETGVKCSGEVYWPPLHMQPVFQRVLKVNEGEFPVAEDVCKRMVCLPIYSQMNLDEAEYVVQNIETALSELQRK